MAQAQWPKKRRLLGTRATRATGPQNSTGRARYSFDITRPGMKHAVMLRCPHARAKIKTLDTTDAEKAPGFAALFKIADAGRELFFAGEDVLALAADTEEHAQDALRLVKVEYEVLEHIVREEDALKDRNKLTVGGKGTGNVIPAVKEYTKGDVAKAFGEADAVVEGDYGVPVISHQCLESHGLVAEWDKDGGLTVWASTQATTGVAGALAQRFSIPPTKVKCVTHYMGGGFGSKFAPEVEGIAAAELAKKAGAPVKLMLDRAEEVTT